MQEPVMSAVISLDDFRPHNVVEVQCLYCTHAMVSVHPAPTPPMVECSNCGQMTPTLTRVGQDE